MCCCILMYLICFLHITQNVFFLPEYDVGIVDRYQFYLLLLLRSYGIFPKF